MPISFEYNKPGKMRGIRVGNPRAVFIMRKRTARNVLRLMLFKQVESAIVGKNFPTLESST